MRLLKFLNELALGHGISSGPYTGRTDKDVLQDILTGKYDPAGHLFSIEGRPFKFANNSKCLEILNATKGQKKFPIIYLDTGESADISLANIAKTPLFGGKFGSEKSASKTTVASEAFVAYFAAMASKLGKELVYDVEKVDKVTKVIRANFTADDIGDAAILCDVNVGPDDVISATFDIDPGNKEAVSLIKSCVGSANAIKKNLLGSGQYEFYRGYKGSSGNFMNFIYDVAKDVSNYAIDGIQFDANKWNPGDIWAIKSSEVARLSNALVNINFLNDLNKLILKETEAKNLFALSLKMNPTGSASIKSYNMKPDLVYNLSNVKLLLESGRGSFTSAMNGTIEFNVNGNPESIALRATGSLSSFSFNINGKYAQGGRIGVGPLEKLLGIKLNTSESFYDPTNKAQVNELWAMYSKIGGKITNANSFFSEIENFTKVETNKLKLQRWMGNRFMGLQVMLQYTGPSGYENLKKCFLAASSQIRDFSSAFYKVM